MGRLKSVGAAVLASGVALSATSALACVPMPRNTEYELANASAAFLARVVSIEQGDHRACESELRRAGVRDGDPGSRSCEAFGTAELQPIHAIHANVLIPETVTVEWTSYPFCYIGWNPEVGEVVVAMIPADPGQLREGTDAYVDPFDQDDPAMRALIGELGDH